MNFAPANVVHPQLREVATMKDRVWALQAAMRELPQIEPVTTHQFADGMYCRTIATPAGTTIVGKVHKREHFYVILSGTVIVTTDAGVEEITGPRVMVGKPGTKRAVHSLTDSVRLTFHRTDLTDLDAIERELIEDDPSAMFGPDNKVLPYTAERFRALTQKVIAAEKRGFWSDWTPEQQALYQLDEWKSFSRSRGYSEREIAEYGAWRQLATQGALEGHRPFVDIADMAMAAALQNSADDARGEIALSSVVRPWMEGIK